VPGWEGPVVPPAWMEGLAPGASGYRGPALVVQVLRQLGDRTLLISVRALSPADRLSPRESEIVRALAAGKTHRVIAAEIGTSPATVRTQIRTAYTKLGIGSKAELGRLLAELD
jgi:DNA-binding NarL/FixJ family response regulator